ncbi:MAG: 4-Cys prefix domain-containing protein [Heteroscytonema crispum UTEX LB 1556]
MLYCSNPNCSNPFNSDGNNFCIQCGQKLTSLFRNRFRVIYQSVDEVLQALNSAISPPSSPKVKIPGKIITSPVNKWLYR